MALQATEIPISFAGGVDLKSDPKQVLPTKLLKLENGVFTSLKRIKKRNGFPARSQTIDAGGSVSAGRAIFSFQNETLLADGTSLYSLIASSAKWSSRGALVSTAVSTSPVIRNMNQPSAPDSAVNAGLALYAWEDSAGGVYYSVIDTATGAPLVDRVVIDATATRPKVTAIGTLFGIFYVDNTNTLKLRTVSTSTPTTLGAATSIGGGGGTNASGNFDVAIYSATLGFLAVHNSAGTITVYSFDQTLFVNITTLTLAGTSASGGICVVPAVANSQVVIVYYDGTTLKAKVVDNALAGVVTTVTVETVSSIANITGVFTGGNVQLFYSISASPAMNYLVRSATLAGGSYTPTANGVLVRSVGLFAKAFLYGGGIYLPVAFVSALQSSYFVMRSDTVIVAKLTTEAGLAGGFSTRTQLGEVSATSASAFQIGHVIAESQFAQAGSIQVINGLNATTVDFADLQRSFASAELGGVLQVSGGVLQMYDRGRVVEHGFNVYPEGVSVAVYPWGGALDQGAYSWAATYEWIDEQGRRHRSAPMAAAGTLQQFAITANLTNGSPNIVVGGNNGNDANLVFIGMDISGDGIPASTTIIDYGVSANQYVMSNNATATYTGNTARCVVSGQKYKITNNALAGPSITMGTSKELAFPSGTLRTLTVYAITTTSGSAVVPVSSTAGLAVGLSVNFINAAFAGGTTITAVDPTTKTITLSNTAAVTHLTPQIFYVDAFFSMTTAVGSPNLTVSSACATYAATLVGSIVQGANIAYPSTIVSAAGTTIVISQNATGNGTQQERICFPNAIQLSVNQKVQGTSVGAGTYITAISINGGVSSITLSAFPTATGSDLWATSIGLGILTIPTLRLTRKSAVQIAVYRTQANGTIYNRISSATSPTLNQPTLDSILYQDQVPDVTANGDDLLYTTGGVLENIPAPPSIGMAVSKDRVFVIDATDRKTVWYSKQVTVNAPVEFNDALTLTIDPRGTDLTAVSTLDDKAILWKRNGIYFLAGQGPDSTGAQNDFLEAVQVATDTGCIEPRSIVRIPSGLMYQSDKGIYLLDRSLSVSYIGADVEAYNSATIVSASLIEGTTQVRFVLSSGILLVYDYLVGQWGVFTGPGPGASLNPFDGAIAGVVAGGVHNVLSSSGRVVYEDPTTHLDLGSLFYALNVQTAWIALAGIQGFQRVYEALVLGEYASPHTLNLLVAYDYVSSQTTLSIDVPTAPATAYQYRFKLPQQRCEAVQFQIVDAVDAQPVGTGEGFSLSALTLKVGKKQGPFKLPAAQTTG